VATTFDPSPTTFSDELLDRDVECSAFAEFLQPFDRLAPAVRPAPPNRNEASDWPSVLGDNELLAARDAFEQGGKVCLRPIGPDFARHDRLLD
jgi:hypothetical protein